MDPGFIEMHDTVNGFKFVDGKILPSYDQSQNNGNGINHVDLELDVLDIPFVPLSPRLDPSLTVSDASGTPDDQDSDPVLKFLNQILLEENMEEGPSMFHDPLALRAAEKSLYQVIGQKYPPSPYHPLNYDNQLWDNRDSFYGVHSEYTSSSKAGSNFIDSQLIVDLAEPSWEQGLLHQFSSNSFPQASSQSSFGTVNDSKENANTQMSSFTSSESILQFNRGMEEASKFLPTSNLLIMDLDKYVLPQKSEDVAPAIVELEKDDIDKSPSGSKGRKHNYPDDGDSDVMERSSKQSAIYVEERELCEIFDKVLLWTDAKGEQGYCNGDDAQLPLGSEKNSLQNVMPNGSSNGNSARALKNESKRDSVDLRTLLISCAHSVAIDDRRTAYEQLKQISVHSSPTGDVYQRLACVLASGLQARLGGTGTGLYTSFAPAGTLQMLKR